MISRAIATMAIIALMFINGLGNFWFTYGIWPRSWVSFATFFTIGLLLQLVMVAVSKDA